MRAFQVVSLILIILLSSLRIQNAVAYRGGTASPEPAFEKTDRVAKIEDVAWLAGHWLGEGLGGVSEEVWSPPMANTMMGMYRSVREEKVVFYELLTIVEKENSLIMRIKHFTPEFVGWEEKENYVTFPLTRLGNNEVDFSGLEIRRAGDELFMELRIQSKDGKTQEAKFHLKRVLDGERTSH